jgi:hypothetical protein
VHSASSVRIVVENAGRYRVSWRQLLDARCICAIYSVRFACARSGESSLVLATGPGAVSRTAESAERKVARRPHDTCQTLAGTAPGVRMSHSFRRESLPLSCLPLALMPQLSWPVFSHHLCVGKISSPSRLPEVASPCMAPFKYLLNAMSLGFPPLTQSLAQLP